MVIIFLIVFCKAILYLVLQYLYNILFLLHSSLLPFNISINSFTSIFRSFGLSSFLFLIRTINVFPAQLVTEKRICRKCRHTYPHKQKQICSADQQGNQYHQYRIEIAMGIGEWDNHPIACFPFQDSFPHLQLLIKNNFFRVMTRATAEVSRTTRSAI